MQHLSYEDWIAWKVWLVKEDWVTWRVWTKRTGSFGKFEPRGRDPWSQLWTQQDWITRRVWINRTRSLVEFEPRGLDHWESSDQEDWILWKVEPTRRGGKFGPRGLDPLEGWTHQKGGKVWTFSAEEKKSVSPALIWCLFLQSVNQSKCLCRLQSFGF